MTADLVLLAAIGYAVALFLVAFLAERLSARGRLTWLRSPVVYTLSLSVYCTAWTFYGAVGYAARSGLEFMTIYLGPTIVFLSWWWLLRKLVRIARNQRITSVADLISSRYGKSPLLAVLVTLLAVIATTPYIALQLQSVSLSYTVIAGLAPDPSEGQTIDIVIAAGLALFTILFGTRSVDANERHDGIVSAIALEAIVKLAALLAVGIYVVWWVASGPTDILMRIDASPIADWDGAPGRWIWLSFLSGAVILCLPRMFQVMVVEASDERHLAIAGWAFPAYLLLMCLFVVPIAVVGLDVLPQGSNPDLFVLTVPLALGQEGLALFAFLGGFSAATSMVIVASVALATMISNHIVVPLWLRLQTGGATKSGDVRNTVLTARRASIVVVLGMGYFYYRGTGGTEALAAIGLISFAGIAQILPALLGAIFWQGGTRWGAATGLCIGFAIWGYTLILPVFEVALGAPSFFANGPFGIGWLRPDGFLGLVGEDKLLTALLLSLGANSVGFAVVSLFTQQTGLEQSQAIQFVQVFDVTPQPRGWTGGTAEAEDLLVMTQRIIGAKEAQQLFQRGARRQGKTQGPPDPTPDFINAVERELAGSVGAATAHAMIAQITGGAPVSVEDMIAVASEAAEIMEYSAKLEAQSKELTATAAQLREANTQLMALSAQKDAFLSQVSHELRTPMTSIRAVSEILLTGGLEPDETARFTNIIHEESQRLTRLLDDLLDLTVLESGQATLNEGAVNLGQILDRAVSSALIAGPQKLMVIRDLSGENITLTTDPDRLAQVFINLITNAQKYCEAPRPSLTITARQKDGRVEIDFIDNGTGIPGDARAMIFEKFTRLSDQAKAGSAGLGLAISREIMARLGGSLSYLEGHAGAAFRVRL